MKINLTSQECDSAKLFCFPMGERHVRLIKTDDYATINYQIPQNLFDIALAANACRESGIEEVHLYCPYLPYARQDRVCEKGDSFSLKVFANFLNGCDFTSVCSIDIHSTKAGEVINNFHNIDQCTYAIRAVHYCQPDYLICPDKGAANKIVATAHTADLPVVYCNKVRDPKSGQLSGFEIVEGKENIGKQGLIIDDICDGGGTFLGVRSLFDGDVALYTTHGGYTKGFRALTVFSSVITTNSINHNADMDEIKRLKIDFKEYNVW